MTDRIYRIIDKENPDKLLSARASSQSQAIHAVIKERFSARVATQDDCLILGGNKNAIGKDGMTPDPE